MDANEKIVRPFGARLFRMANTEQGIDVLLAITAGVAVATIAMAIRMAYELGKLERVDPVVIFAPQEMTETKASEQ